MVDQAPATVRLISASLTPNPCAYEDYPSYENDSSSSSRNRRRRHRHKGRRRHERYRAAPPVELERIILVEEEPEEIRVPAVAADAPVTPLSIYDLLDATNDDASSAQTSDESPGRGLGASNEVSHSQNSSLPPPIRSFLCDPLEVSMLESDGVEALAEKEDVSFEEAFEMYLKQGFACYAKWYAEQLTKQLGVSEATVHRALFSVARRINAASPGLLLAVDVRHIIWKETKGGTVAQFDNTFANRVYQRLSATRRLQDPSLSDKKDVPLMEELRHLAASYKQADSLDEWYHGLVSLSVEEFVKTIEDSSNVAALAEASAKIWRGTNTLVSVTKKPDNKALDDLFVDMDTISQAEPYAPLPGYHLGVAWLISADTVTIGSTSDDIILPRRFLLPAAK